jgi:ribulose-5-phosphate 4-epimerase/fuculose-1-phosphate aldolase
VSTSLDEATARSAICRVGRSLFDRGYVHATAGNISVRLADGFLITPTDACLGFLDADRLARLDADGRQIAGDRASKTITLHRRIYAATAAGGRPASAVIHTHSTSLVACSLKAFEASERVMKVGRVPHIPYHRPGADDAAETVAQAIAHHASHGRHIRAVMLARLGPNVWHDTPAAAMAVLEELEETARLWLLARPEPLDEAQIAELRSVFGATW